MARYVLLTQRAELVFDQSVATWLRLHRAAFEFFGGVPRRVVLDNLRAAIVHAALYDPEVQRSDRELAEHYGFLIAPCRPRTPEHKGKVEQGGVHYVKRNALAGRNFRDLHDGNPPSAPLDRRDRRPPRPRDDQEDPPGSLRPGGTRGAAAAARHPLGADRVETGQAPSRLPCRLCRRLLLRAPSPHRPAALGPGHGLQGRAVSGLRPRRHAPSGASRPAAHPRRASPPR